MSMMGDMVQRSRTLYVSNNPPVVPTVMSLEESRRTQRPYRYGMILLCVGALVNWLGLAENYSEPIRYTGVACILAGACLICTAMCCWLHTPNRTGSSNETEDPVHVISSAEERRCEKPPDYDSVAVAPPSYDDAIKLDPAALLHLVADTNTAPSNGASPNVANGTNQNTAPSSSTFNFSGLLGRSLDNRRPVVMDSSNTPTDSFCTENEKHREKPPPYDATGLPAAAAIIAALPAELNPALVATAPSCN